VAATGQAVTLADGTTAAAIANPAVRCHRRAITVLLVLARARRRASPMSWWR